MPSENGHTAVKRTLDILEIVSKSREGITNAGLSRRLSIPKSSASYILRTLHARGYLHRDPEGGRYKLGLIVHTLGNRVLEATEVRDIALPFMHEFVRQTNVMCALSMTYEDEYEIMTIDKLPVRRYHLIRRSVGTQIGSTISLHSSAAGKMLLALKPRANIESLMRARKLERNTPKTITSFPHLMAELAKVRKRGYALSDEEDVTGVRCLSVPIFDLSGDNRIWITATGTIQDMADSRLVEVSASLKTAARAFSQRLVIEKIQSRPLLAEQMDPTKVC